MNNPLYNLGLQHGLEKGREQGREREARLAIADICEMLGLELTAARRGHLEQLNLQGLEALRAHLKTHRMWPESSAPTT